jgi:hypothetical protein
MVDSGVETGRTRMTLPSEAGLARQQFTNGDDVSRAAGCKKAARVGCIAGNAQSHRRRVARWERLPDSLVDERLARGMPASRHDGGSQRGETPGGQRSRRGDNVPASSFAGHQQ